MWCDDEKLMSEWAAYHKARKSWFAKLKQECPNNKHSWKQVTDNTGGKWKGCKKCKTMKKI